MCTYLPIGTEPGSAELPEALRSAGHEVLLPVVPAQLGPLDWARYDGPDDLGPGPIGLREPTGPRLGPTAIGRRPAGAGAGTGRRPAGDPDRQGSGVLRPFVAAGQPRGCRWWWWSTTTSWSTTTRRSARLPDHRGAAPDPWCDVAREYKLIPTGYAGTLCVRVPASGGTRADLSVPLHRLRPPVRGRAVLLRRVPDDVSRRAPACCGRSSPRSGSCSRAAASTAPTAAPARSTVTDGEARARTGGKDGAGKDGGSSNGSGTAKVGADSGSSSSSSSTSTSTPAAAAS